MPPIRTSTSVAVLVALLLVGCGGKTKPAGGELAASKAAPKLAALDASIASLVPSDAVALVYVRSPTELATKVRRVVAKFDAETAEGIDATAIAAMVFQGQPDLVDLDKPMALAMSWPGGEPGAGGLLSGQGMTVVVGVKDPAAAKKSVEEGLNDRYAAMPEGMRPKPEEMPQVTVAGSYLTISEGPAGPRGGSRLARQAPAYDLALRVDLAALVTRLRPDIDKFLAGLEEGPDGPMAGMPPQLASMSGMFQGLVSGARDFVDSADVLDLGLTIDGGEVEAALGFAAKAGSKLDVASHTHAGLPAVAALLPGDMPFHVLASLDMVRLMTWARPLMTASLQALPEGKRKAMEGHLDAFLELAKMLGPNMGAAGELGEQGLQIVEVVDVSDGPAFVQRCEALMTGEAVQAFPGIAVTKGGTTTVAGVEVHAYEVAMDMKKVLEAQGQDVPAQAGAMAEGMLKRMFGGDTLHLQIATVDHRLLYTMGAPGRMEKLIERVRSGGQAPAGLQKGLDRAGEGVVFMLQLDLRPLMASSMELAGQAMDRPMPAVPAGKPVPILLWGKHDGRVYGGGLRVDLDGIAELVRAMSPSGGPGEDESGK